LASEVSFAQFARFVSNPLAKLVLLILIWSFLHHFFAGIRYLLLDLEVGVEKANSSRSAILVLLLGFGASAMIALKMFGLF
jgi:succinate dehydrogenase / fumarate reductase cytochrome b subunit